MALSLLTAAASVIPGRDIMAAPGWTEPCILWTALVGPSSSAKTPALEAACGLLRELENLSRRGPHNPRGTAVPKPTFTKARLLM